jgi:membrane associated rhomboid family serine protease
MPLWAAMMFLLFGLWIISIFAGLPIGNTAHFGGFVCGVIFGVYLRMKYKKKVRLLNKYILGGR